MNSVLIIAGENSGEKYGADLVREFRKLHPDAEFSGIGGNRMQQAGVDLLYSVDSLALMGIFEVLAHIPRIRSILRHIRSEVRASPPRAAVLIDSPDFNLRLARSLKKQGIPILYYISPTVWAWRKNRLKHIRRYVDRMLLIFPFEEKVYAEEEIPAVFVGHPLLESLSQRLSREEFFQKYDLNPERPLITLLPGSRTGEIQKHLPVLVETLHSLRRDRDVQFLLLKAEHLSADLLKEALSACTEKVPLLASDHCEALAASDLALSACGTANLEAALLGTPVIAFYRISPLTYVLGKPFVKIPHYSIVNILADSPIIPEFIQKDFTAANLCRAALSLLDDRERREEMLKQFVQIRHQLGEKRASENAARELARLYSQ
jgi:lipid-A-disaccharide synthase